MVKKSTDAASGSAPAAEIKATTADAKKPGGYCCYIGPSIPGLIRNGAIFRGSPADACAAAKAAIEAEPLVKTLIVPSITLPGDRLKVKTPGNALYENYRRIAGKK